MVRPHGAGHVVGGPAVAAVKRAQAGAGSRRAGGCRGGANPANPSRAALATCNAGAPKIQRPANNSVFAADYARKTGYLRTHVVEFRGGKRRWRGWGRRRLRRRRLRPNEPKASSECTHDSPTPPPCWRFWRTLLLLPSLSRPLIGCADPAPAGRRAPPPRAADRARLRRDLRRAVLRVHWLPQGPLRVFGCVFIFAQSTPRAPACAPPPHPPLTPRARRPFLQR